MKNTFQPGRRSLLKSLAFAGAASVCPMSFAEIAPGLGSALPAWSEGCFDMHHIDTARGNSTLLIFPDGTTMLIDAGAESNPPAGTVNPARPNASRTPGEWIASYILAHAPAPRLDYFLATHIHPDHVSGLPAVAARLPISTFIDRAFPHYAPNQRPSSASYAQEYLAFLSAHAEKVEVAQTGSTRQIVERRKPASNHGFSARILSANGNVWNPATHAVDAHLAQLPRAASAHGYENNFSIATCFEYGAFRYFTGGDLDCDTFDGRMPELDIETPVVKACGRVDVAVADHHGYFDACGPAFVNSLEAQAYIVPSWDIGHPGSAQMQRMEGAWDFNNSKATHDVFTLELLPQNALLNRRFAPQLKSQQGHVVVRVAPGGSHFTIYALDATVQNGTVSGIFGPYMSQGAATESNPNQG
jgi:L-ascorbate metabolism protein UlaG (beta-lactamase superfamily)